MANQGPSQASLIDDINMVRCTQILPSIDTYLAVAARVIGPGATLRTAIRPDACAAIVKAAPASAFPGNLKAVNIRGNTDKVTNGKTFAGTGSPTVQAPANNAGAAASPSTGKSRLLQRLVSANLKSAWANMNLGTTTGSGTTTGKGGRKSGANAGAAAASASASSSVTGKSESCLVLEIACTDNCQQGQQERRQQMASVPERLPEALRRSDVAWLSSCRCLNMALPLSEE